MIFKRKRANALLGAFLIAFFCLALMRFAPQAHAANEKESNDTFDTATSISINTTVNATYSKREDVDYFKFTMPKSGTIKLTLANDRYHKPFFNCEYKFRMFNSYYEEIAPEDSWSMWYYTDTTKPKTYTFKLSKGTYYLKASYNNFTNEPTTNHPYHIYVGFNPNVAYKTHVQTYGWQGWKSNGATSGTTGKSKRLEGINIKLSNTPYSGGIQYRTHIQTYGWEKGWKSNGAMSGTSGKSKRLEAIQIKLTGEMAKKYDVYYRVHAQKFGWMGWAKNGQSAGTAGYSYRLEGIQIKLVKKGGKAPGTTKNCFRQKK